MDVRVNKWDNTFDRRLPYKVVKPKALILWLQFGLKEVRGIGDSLFLFIFSNEEGPKLTFDNGSWFILKQAIILKVWSENVDFKKESFVTLPIWVKIYIYLRCI